MPREFGCTGEEDDPRDAAGVAEEYLALLDESVALRFRADVPIGINISGGVDSSLLLALVRRTQGDAHADVRAFTFETGDPRYDETPWVRPMLERTGHPASVVRLSAAEVPDAARAVAEAQDEPYGGIPTLAYAKLFEEARRLGIIVLLDGQGMDEQWAGYDYYRRADDQALVQGGTSAHLQPQALCPEFAALAQPPSFPQPFRDPLKNLQYRDLLHTKLPRALRFNDRVSMRVGCELREPFLDHRLVELALRQPRSRKIGDAGGKQMLREIAGALVPERTRLAPKRPLQTPQREWLRGPLASWARDRIEHALEAFGGAWLDPVATRRKWEAFSSGALDTSFFVWQWISISLAAELASARSDGATG